jgi:HAD superfamily phosphoserine phosphatase-like hydrolase
MSILRDPAVQKFLTRHTYHNSPRRPVAVFDCDGTVIKGDIGESMLYYQIEHFRFKRSPGSIWADHPQREELDHFFQELSEMPPRRRLAQPGFEPFAELILSWYFNQIAEGHVTKACADIVRLFAGHTRAEVRAIGEATFAYEYKAEVKQRPLGRRMRPVGVRFIKESTELLAELRKRGFDIWAVSGSNTWSVEPVFKRLGVPADHVIGIELLEENGVLTPIVALPVPIREAKVEALKARVADLPVLVASDSKNDIPLFLYSSDLKLRVNSRRRDTPDFFRVAGVPHDATWIVIEEPTIDDQDHDQWPMPL